MFIHQAGKYWKLSENRWTNGSPKRLHVASLGKTEKAAVRRLKDLLKSGTINQAEFDRFSERLDTDIWGTPQWVLDLARGVMGSIDLDPCTQAHNPTKADQFFTKADDGLKQKWHGRVWLNPPYSQPLPWIRTLTDGYEEGNIEQAIALVKSGTLQNKGTGSLINGTATAKAGWNGRLQFESLREARQTKAPDFDVSIVYWGCHADLFREMFEPYCYF